MKLANAVADDCPVQWPARPENLLLYALARQQFSDLHRGQVLRLCSDQIIDWELLRCTSRNHNVLPLIASNLIQIREEVKDLPQSLVDACLASLVESDSLAELQRSEFVKVAHFFQDRGVEVMPVKGLALDLIVYERAWYTIKADIDLLVRYSRGDEHRIDQREMIALFRKLKTSFECETHHHDLSINGVLPIDFDLIWHDASALVFRDVRLFSMCPEDLLIVVSINCFRKGVFLLKAMCDVSETIRACGEVNWQNVWERARKYKCEGIVYAVLLSVSHTIGTTCWVPLESLAISGPRTSLIRLFSMKLASVSVCLNREWKSKFKRHVFRNLLSATCLPLSLYPRGLLWILTSYFEPLARILSWYSDRTQSTVRSSNSVCRF